MVTLFGWNARDSFCGIKNWAPKTAWIPRLSVWCCMLGCHWVRLLHIELQQSIIGSCAMCVCRCALGWRYCAPTGFAVFQVWPIKNLYGMHVTEVGEMRSHDLILHSTPPSHNTTHASRSEAINAKEMGKKSKEMLNRFENNDNLLLVWDLSVVDRSLVRRTAFLKYHVRLTKEQQDLLATYVDVKSTQKCKQHRRSSSHCHFTVSKLPHSIQSWRCLGWQENGNQFR